MKKTILFFIFSFRLCHGILAQGLNPAGIEGAVLWCESISNDVGQACFKARFSNGQTLYYTFADQDISLGNFNFHPALDFKNASASIQLPLEHIDLSRMTVFTVYWPIDTFTEKSVWHLEKNSRNQLMLTTQRVADLESIDFMNFIGRPKDVATLSVYEQFKASDTQPIIRQHLFLGKKPISPDVPVTTFRGRLAELIVFDRVLSPEERQVMSTWLALKYGITLEPIGSSVYSLGKDMLLRDSKTCLPYIWHVAGIGNAAHLIQKQSTSSEEAGLLAIGFDSLVESNLVNSAVIPPQTFLNWADDDMGLRLMVTTQGLPKQLSRKWMMSVKAEGAYPKTMVQLDTRQTDWNWNDGQTWWLVIDRSGTGRFSVGQVAFYPAEKVDNNGFATFRDIDWDSDGSGTDVFTFSVAPPFFVGVWIEAPPCNPVAGGQITLAPQGGTAPYTISLTNRQNGRIVEGKIESNLVMETLPIEAGWYMLEALDGNGKSWRDTFFVQSLDAPALPPNQLYMLTPGRPLLVEAPIACGHCSFEWEGSAGFRSTDSKIWVEEPGEYVLTVSEQECKAIQTIQVIGAEDPFRYTALFPSPAPGGAFNVLLDLWASASVDISILDSNGRLVSSRRMTGSDRYLSQFQLSVPAGVYIMNAATPEGERSVLFEITPDRNR